MRKRIVSLVLVLVMVLSMVPVYAGAATQSSNSPYAWIEYGYSSTVECGTVRYISQVSSDTYFYSSYWPASNFGYYVGAQVECGTASMSMALSYIGVNKTPKAILEANNGATVFNTGWGGSTYVSYSASNLSGAMDAYINGNGKYSPPVIHIPGYSAAGHYVVVVGKISSGKYQILDPWQRALTTMTVSGSSATYTTYGSTTYDTIDQIHQWYNPNASLSYTSSCTAYASSGTIQATTSTPVNTEPCSVGSYGSTTIETASVGDTYDVVKLYRNSFGNLWYQVTSKSGKTGYMYGGHVTYIKENISDIKITGATAPNGQVAGTGFVVNGTISATNNELTTATLTVYSGFGTAGTKAMTASGTVNGKSYALTSSAIDANTKFGSLATGKYTYVMDVSYINYYHTDTTTLASNTGTVRLMEEYFVVIPSSANQSSCSHSYSTTVIEVGSCTAPGKSVQSCSKCGKVNTVTSGADGHSYGSWTVVNATCTSAGSRTRKCSACGDVQTETVAATGHSYAVSKKDATCKAYASYTYTCSDCGDYYVISENQMTSQWVEAIPQGMDASRFRTKTQYRYADIETTTSYETSLEGYTQNGSEWIQSGTNTVNYVSTWPSGFSTSNSLYTKYNNKSSKVTASETATTKTVVNSDAVVGYLWYHWCYTDSYYSVSSKSGSYTTFHAYYGTTAPGNYNYDSSDGSYCTSHSTCSNSDWWWPLTVYAQKSTSYQKLFTYERWTDWSDWSDTAVTASTTRKVETQTVYQLKEAKLGDHVWSDGVCSVCATECSHNFVDGYCTVCRMEEPNKDYYLFGYINGANYACEEDAANIGIYKFVDGKLVVTFDKVSYVGVKTGNNAKWYMTDGYVGDDVTGVTLYETGLLESADKLRVPRGREITFTLVENADGTLSLSYVAAGCEHSWSNGVCTNCDEVCDHASWAFGKCEDCGLACTHTWVDGVCSTCGSWCSHEYRNNICNICGMKKPVKDYYLFGYINYADYGCEGDYQNLGQYKFVNGKLTARFEVDSYVAVKSGDNLDWYMTNGWLGTDVTAATLYNTNTGANEKLFVPGGVDVTFTLIDNGNDTYLLTYSVSAPTVTDPTIAIDHPSLSFESEILYNFYFTAGDLTDVVEMGMITFATKQTDGTVANAEKVYPGYTSVGGGMYMVQTEGISAKNLGDAVYMKIYAKLTDGSYVYTSVVGYNAVVYAKSILKNSTNAYMKQLVVAMVNYGTEAQMYFGHNTSSPMNSFLTAEQKALVQEYNTGMVNAVASVDSTKAGSLAYNGSSFAKRAPSVSFDGAFSINYYFTTANVPDGEVKLYYWTLEDYNAATKLSPKNATGSMSMTNISGNQYWGQVSGIAAKELDETVFVLGVYAYNGTTYTTGVLNYHIGKYCTTLAAKDTSEQQELAKATAVYGHYAKEYFANI